MMSYQAPQRLAAVVLDWAGVTVDFGSRAPVLAMRAAFEQHGVAVLESEVRAHMGKAKREHLAAMLTEPRLRDAWSHQGYSGGDEDLDRVYSSFLGLQEECISSHSDLIAGCLESVGYCRSEGLRIGSTTGYTSELLSPVAARASELGYRPDATVCAGEVSPGRPAPWLCLEIARRLGVYPPAAIIKVDDTPAGVTAGRNAGAWAVGVVISGNEVGLCRDEWIGLTTDQQAEHRRSAAVRLKAAGAHLLIDTIAELPSAIAEINAQLSDGLAP